MLKKIPPALLDFVDRVGSTFGAAFFAVYVADKSAATLKPALIAGAVSAGKFAYLRLQVYLMAASKPAAETPTP